MVTMYTTQLLEESTIYTTVEEFITCKHYV